MDPLDEEIVEQEEHEEDWEEYMDGHKVFRTQSFHSCICQVFQILDVLQLLLYDLFMHSKDITISDKQNH